MHIDGCGYTHGFFLFAVAVDILVVVSWCRSENEKNRRRNMLLVLRNERDGMIHGLKRPGRKYEDTTRSGRPQETDDTAEKNNEQLLRMQQMLMEEQDEALDHIERSVATTKHVALQIHEETELQNRLLGDLDDDVHDASSRLELAQRHMKMVMRKARGCKAQLLLMMTMLILVLVLILSYKLFV